MSSPESSPEWIVSRSSSETNTQPLSTDDRLITVAKRLWPRVQAHARKELPKWNPDDSLALATEIWEGVLVSVSKTLQRQNRSTSEIADLDAYLFAVYLHRFNRALKRERRRQETIELVASSRELEQLEGARMRRRREILNAPYRLNKRSRTWTLGHGRSSPRGCMATVGARSQNITD
jgi:hypothetical protein